MKVIEAAIDQIEVGERRRQDYGDIGALAKGIKRVGLLEPIVIDRIGKANRYRLVAGERRLKAVTMLKWKTVPAHLLEELADADRRDLELEENENRKSLTESERRRTLGASKKLVDNAKRAAEILAQSGPEKTGKRGQPAKADSTRAVANTLGTSRQSVERAERHVAAVEKFPFMQGNEWRQSDVLRVQERLGELPESERDQAAGVLACAKILDPALTVKLVENIGAKKPNERAEIYRLSQSTDSRDQSLALTKAAELPPMPDPRLGIIDNACHILGAAIKPFPNDPLTPRLLSIRDELRRVRAEVKEVSFDAQKPKQAQQGAAAIQ